MQKSAAWTKAGIGLIVLMTLLAYIPALRGGFVWDDDAHVTQNPTLRSVGGLIRIWFNIGATPQYYPLVFTSFWFEFQLWGPNPFGYKLVNALLHITTAILLWLVLRRLSVPGAWLAAGIFALHPVHVESVAWVTERKNVLSGVFYLSALLVYLRMTGVTGSSIAKAEQRRLYLLALALYACALLSKSVTCSLPAAILLILWWKQDRLRWRDVAPLLPFFVLGLGMALLTAWLEKHLVGTVHVEWGLSFVDRCLVAGRVLWFYVGTLIWPHELAFIYPRWQIDAGLWWQYLFPAGAIGLVVCLWLLRRRIGRAPLTAALFFGGTLVPALGFVDVYPMRFSFVADHFQYLASIGPITLFAALLAKARRMMSRAARSTADLDGRTVLMPAMSFIVPAAVLCALGTATWQQGRVYKDLETLWRDTLEKNPASYMPHYNLAKILVAQGRDDEAIKHYNETLRLAPDHTESLNNLGNILARRGRLTEAIAYYSEALRIEPDRYRTHNNMGLALEKKGQLRAARGHYRQALQANPDFALAHGNLANLLLTQGQAAKAIEHYAEVVRLEPDRVAVRCRLAGLLEKEGRYDEALREYRQVLRHNPQHAEAAARLRTLERMSGP